MGCYIRKDPETQNLFTMLVSKVSELKNTYKYSPSKGYYSATGVFFNDAEQVAWDT
jgi:hypothetical protein